jgi:hypothetical protein
MKPHAPASADPKNNITGKKGSAESKHRSLASKKNQYRRKIIYCYVDVT